MLFALRQPLTRLLLPAHTTSESLHDVYITHYRVQYFVNGISQGLYRLVLLTRLC
jgi:hypothetical protein